MEGSQVVDVMKMKTSGGDVNKQKEISDTATGAGSCDSAMVKSLNFPCGTNIASNQLTIFYGGQVSVFESIPADKAREIMLMAVSAAKNKRDYNLSSSSSSIQTIANPFNTLCKLQSAELPFTRTRSLQLFFEKRRDRLVKKTPYSTNGKQTIAERNINT